MDWKLLSSTEFETLALSYAKFKYKDYDWNPTNKTRDDNHDFFYIERDEFQEEWEGWGEAKHSNEIKSRMSRTKWDQTIISGKLANNVKHIMFVTNAHIPKRYIFRAECLKTPPFEKFEYVNNSVLEEWLYYNPKFIPKKLKASFDYNPSYVDKKITIDFFVADYFSASRNILNSKKEVYANKDYLLFVVVESNYNTRINIKLIPDDILKIYPYEREDISNMPIKVGLNCSKFIINFCVHGTHVLNIKAEDHLFTNKASKKIKFEVLNDFEPQILYQNQLSLLETLLDQLNNSKKANCIYTLYAPKGTGKTYLLRMLLKEPRLFNRLLYLTFVADEAECARNICTLFLALNFGIDFAEPSYWNEILQLYLKYPEEEIIMTAAELQEIYNGSQKDNTGASLVGFEKIKKFSERNGFQLLKTGMKKYIILILDDIHKVPANIGEFLSSFIKKFIIESWNEKILFAGREHEFESKALNDTIKISSEKEYKLSSPLLTEKKESLQRNFPFIQDVDFFSNTLNRCHSTMLFCILLRQIYIFTEKNGQNELKLQIQLASMFKEMKKGNISIEYQDFLFYKKDFGLLFLIYAYCSGLNINFFKELGVDAVNTIHRLIKAGILEEQESYIFPAHDTYQDVFERICQSSQFSDEKKYAANLLYQYINSDYIDKFKALPVLLVLDDSYNDKYIEESMNLLELYYKTTEFGKMNLLCEKIIQKRYPYTEKNCWNKEKLWLFYLYAECLDHCGSLQHSQACFEMVYDNGLVEITDDSMDFIYDAKAQIFNIRYALLDTVNLLTDIDSFLKKNFHKTQSQHSIFFEKAFLNALNRRMVISLLLDKYEEAKNVAKAYKTLSFGLDNSSHKAFYYIDYARGNYHQDPWMSLEFMKKAYNEFSLLPNEKRRFIDSKSEMYFLECVVQGADLTTLDKISEEIIQNGYVHMYIHTLLKRAAIRICNGELDIAQNLLNRILSIVDLEQFTRTKMLFCNLMSAIYFLRNDKKKMEEYIKLQNKLAQNIGISYRNDRKIDKLERVAFNFNAGEDYFPIETRLW